MPTTSYTARLGVPVPAMETLAERYRKRELKLIDLLVAVLLERGGPVAPEEAGARLAELGITHWRGDLGPILKKAMAPSPEVTTDEEGRFILAILDRKDRHLERRLEALDPPAPRPAPATPPTREEIDRGWREREAAEEAEAAALRRVLLHAVPRSRRGNEAPRAVALLDPVRREIETFVGDELADLPGQMEAYDLVIGVSPRPVLGALGLDPDAFRIADLDRPQKTRKLNQRGRVLKITNEMLISATLGTSRPLGEEAKYREYLERGHLGRLRRRLEADVKTLWAYYRFGLLHRAVRLRWGFLDERIGCDWAQPGDPSIYRLERKALEEGKRLEVVVGRPPVWSDPWGRTTLCEVVKTAGRPAELFPVAGEPADSGDIYDARLEERPAWVETEAKGGEVRLPLSLEERDLVLEHCLLLDPEMERRLELAPVVGPGAIEIGLDLDELEELGGSVAFAANHADDEQLQHRLDIVHDRIATAERWAVN